MTVFNANLLAIARPRKRCSLSRLLRLGTMGLRSTCTHSSRGPEEAGPSVHLKLPHRLWAPVCSPNCGPSVVKLPWVRLPGSPPPECAPSGRGTEANQSAIHVRPSPGVELRRPASRFQRPQTRLPFRREGKCQEASPGKDPSAESRRFGGARTSQSGCHTGTSAITGLFSLQRNPGPCPKFVRRIEREPNPPFGILFHDSICFLTS